jgi:chromosome segregation ATPase
MGDTSNAMDSGLEQAIQKATEKISKEISSFETRAALAENEHNKLYDEWEKARKELSETLEMIDMPFKQKTDSLWKEKDYCKGKANDLKRDLEDIEYEVRYQYALKNGIELDEKSFAGLLHKIGETRAIWLASHVRKFDKKLSNGITLFRYESRYVNYFAIRGTELIAIHKTRKAEHMGDRPDFEHYIGQEGIENRSGEDNYFLSFREWKAKLENYGTAVNSIEPINLDNEENKKIISRML